MARIARVILPGYPHHITQRGNRRQDVFFKTSDYEDYLNLLKEWCEKEKIGYMGLLSNDKSCSPHRQAQENIQP